LITNQVSFNILIIEIRYFNNFIMIMNTDKNGPITTIFVILYYIYIYIYIYYDIFYFIFRCTL